MAAGWSPMSPNRTLGRRCRFGAKGGPGPGPGFSKGSVGAVGVVVAGAVIGVVVVVVVVVVIGGSTGSCNSSSIEDWKGQERVRRITGVFDQMEGSGDSSLLLFMCSPPLDRL